MTLVGSWLALAVVLAPVGAALLHGCARTDERAPSATAPSRPRPVHRSPAPVAPSPTVDPHAAAEQEAATLYAARLAAIGEAARQAEHGLPPGDGSLRVALTISEARGVSGIERGTTCEVWVTHRDQDMDSAHCHASLDCADHALYGIDDGQGYFQCTAFAQSPALIIGADRATSAQDGDPMLAIDSIRGTFTMSDDARGEFGRFSLRGSITVRHDPGSGDADGRGYRRGS